MNTRHQLYLSLNLGRRVLLLLLLFIVGFAVIGVIAAFVGMDTAPKARIITVMQDILMFIMPAVVMAVMVTRQPATLLAIDVKPSGTAVAIAVIALLVSMPAMEWVIGLNDSIHLPADLEQTFRTMEQNAEDTVQLVCGSHDIPNLIMSILIVGVLAGLSEEIFFRGGLQRLLVTGGVNIHAAIWITAAVFSLMHFQIYGFVPRTLLGAYFGYTLYWTGSLWVSVILHIFNNTIFLVLQYSGLGESSMSPWLIAVSVALTAIALAMLRRKGACD